MGLTKKEIGLISQQIFYLNLRDEKSKYFEDEPSIKYLGELLSHGETIKLAAKAVVDWDNSNIKWKNVTSVILFTDRRIIIGHKFFMLGIGVLKLFWKSSYDYVEYKDTEIVEFNKDNPIKIKTKTKGTITFNILNEANEFTNQEKYSVLSDYFCNVTSLVLRIFTLQAPYIIDALKKSNDANNNEEVIQLIKKLSENLIQTNATLEKYNDMNKALCFGLQHIKTLSEDHLQYLIKSGYKKAIKDWELGDLPDPTFYYAI